MPPKTKTINLPPNQSSIKLFFSKSAAKSTVTDDLSATTKSTTPNPASTPQMTPTTTTTEDPKIAAFMASLSANELLAHKIAVEKLGTSYDITRTHGFKNWSNRT